MVHSHHFLVACSVLDHELFHHGVVASFTPNPRSCFTLSFFLPFCPHQWVRLLEVQPSIFVFWEDEYAYDSQPWFNMSFCGMHNMLSHCYGHLNTPLNNTSTNTQLVESLYSGQIQCICTRLKDGLLSWFKGEFLLSKKFGSNFIISYPKDNAVADQLVFFVSKFTTWCLVLQFCHEMTKTLSSLLATTIEQESVINHIVVWLAIFVKLLQNTCYFDAVQGSPWEGFVYFASLPITAKSVAIRTGSGFFTTAVAFSKFDQAFFQTFQLFFATPSVKFSLQWKKITLCQFALPKLWAPILLRQVNNTGRNCRFPFIVKVAEMHRHMFPFRIRTAESRKSIFLRYVRVSVTFSERK